MRTGVEKLWMFAGTGRAFAYSVDRSGANLPEEYAPWRFLKSVSTAGPTFKAGADKAALREVAEKGFSIQVYKITFDSVTTIPEKA